jgi:hypothetical protein
VNNGLGLELTAKTIRFYGPRFNNELEPCFEGANSITELENLGKHTARAVRGSQMELGFWDYIS